MCKEMVIICLKVMNRYLRGGTEGVRAGTQDNWSLV
jgi:hypothetical protein